MADRSILIQGLIELHLAGKGGDEAVASMQKIIAQAKEVEKSTEALGDGAKKSAKGVSALEASFISLGKTVAGYFAAGVVANFLKDSFLGFARTERQALALEQQIRSLGDAAGESNFRGFIAQTSETYGILDDDLVPALQRALLGFKNLATAEEVVTIASKFAANGIGDVGSNVEKITRFFQTGSAKSLVEFGINVKAGEEATLDLNEGIRLLIDTANGMPATFDDAQKSINQWRNDIDNAKDAIGRLEAGLIRALQSAGTFAGEAIDTVFNPENIVKNAEGQKIISDLAAKADKDRAAAASALAAQAAEEQKRRDAKANEDKAKDAVKAEEDRLAKVADLNEKAAQDLIKQTAQYYEEGSDERYQLELELNRRVEAAAIESAQKIGADTLAIAAFFAGERGKLAAARGETKSEKAAREDAAQFDPRAGFEEVEAAAAEHESRMADIAAQGATQTAQIKVDLAADERSRLDAEMELELAQVKAASDARVAAAEEDADAIIEIRRQQAEAEDAIRKLNDLAIQQSARRQQATIVGAAGATVAAFATIFNDNKAMQYAATIVNTASAIMSALAVPPYPVGVALAVAAAATGAAQLATIARTQIGSGGGGSDGASVASAGVASYPSSPIPAGVAMPSQSDLSSLSGSRSGAQSMTINIANAFGDDQSMNRLVRKITGVMRNDQSVLR